MSDYRDTLLEMKAEALRCKASSSAYAAALLQREADAIDALLAKLDAKDAALAEIEDAFEDYQQWQGCGCCGDSERLWKARQRIYAAIEQARAAHGAKEQA